jgi:hypothetical protein
MPWGELRKSAKSEQHCIAADSADGIFRITGILKISADFLKVAV